MTATAREPRPTSCAWSTAYAARSTTGPIVYQRTWRATVVSSFLAPLLYVVAMGVLLGGFIEADPDVLEGATSYFDFVVPGLIAAHAMQTAVGETTFPVMGMIKWQRIYDSMLATPLGCRDLVAAHLSFVLFRLATTCGVYTLVLAPFGVYATWWGPIAAFGEPGAGRHGLRGLGLRLQRPDQVRGGVRGAVPARRVPAVPVLAARSSRSATSATSARGSPGCTPLWHGVNLSRMFALDNVTWWVAARQRRRAGRAHRRRLVLGGLRPREAARLMTAWIGTEPSRSRPLSCGAARGCCVLAQLHRLPQGVEAVRHRLPRAVLLPALDRHRRRRS